MLRKLIKKILFNPSLAKKITIFLLQIMNKAYYLLGIFATAAEKGVHPKHRLTDYHRFFLDNVNLDDRVLDAGCGNGLLTRDIALKVKEAIGVDIDKKNIEKAQIHCKDIPQDRVKFITADVTTYDFKEPFDKVVLSNILEHIKDRGAFLNKIKRLAPVLLIRVPMLNRDWITLYKKALGIEYRLDKTHFIEYTLEAFAEELSKAGLEMESYTVQLGEIWARARGSV